MGKKAYRGMVVRRGFVTLAESEEDFFEKVKTLGASDFDWEGSGYQDDCEIIEELEGAPSENFGQQKGELFLEKD